MSFSRLKVEIEHTVAIVTISRPVVMNALDRECLRECRAVWADLAEHRGVRALVLTGAGPSAFSTGADLNELHRRDRDDALDSEASSTCAALERFPKPTIAAINGYALGGGCELALACDIRVAADTARFGFPELGLAVIPAAGGTQRLPRVVGLGWAKHLLLTGDVIDATQALAIGLVTAVVPAADLAAAVRALAARVAQHGPLATRVAKLALNASTSVDLDAGLLIEALAQAICYASEDKQVRTKAFLDRRRHKGHSPNQATT